MGWPEAAVKHARNDGCFRTPTPITDDGSLTTVTVNPSCPIAQKACTSQSPYLPDLESVSYLPICQGKSVCRQIYIAFSSRIGSTSDSRPASYVQLHQHNFFPVLFIIYCIQEPGCHWQRYCSIFVILEYTT